MNKEIKIDNEIQLLAQELERKFSKQQISQWAIDTGFMKRKAKVKPMYFLLLCTLLGESFGQKSLTQLCAQLGATFNIGITTEGLNQRFNTQAVEFLKRMYQSLVTQQLEGSLSFIEERETLNGGDCITSAPNPKARMSGLYAFDRPDWSVLF